MSNHAYINIFFHIVWGTRDKENLIKKDFQKKLYNFIYGITLKKDWHLVEIGGTQDHIHILLQITDFRENVPDIIRCLKSNSSKYVRDCFDKNFGWQNGYSIFSVGRREIEQIKNYIQNQEKHHEIMNCEEEYVLMLKKNSIKYRYKNRFNN
ncbi:MAG: IS200/IS605 family transposase [Candidatus Babeliales bacterium]